MTTKITVVKKGNATKPMGHQCPWILDVPPEASRES